MTLILVHISSFDREALKSEEGYLESVGTRTSARANSLCISSGKKKRGRERERNLARVGLNSISL